MDRTIAVTTKTDGEKKKKKKTPNQISERKRKQSILIYVKICITEWTNWENLRFKNAIK